MKSKWNKSWIAGALVAACVLAVVCFAALPEMGQFAEIESASSQVRESGQPGALQGEAVAPSEYGLQSGSQGEDSFGGQEYEPGVVLVTLPVGVSPADAVAAIAQDTGLEDLALADEADAAVRATTAAETPLLVELSLPEDISVEEATALISASSAIDAVQPNFIYYLNDVVDPEQAARESLVAQNFIAQDLVAQATVNDTNVNDQWALESIYAYHVGTATDSNADYAWDVVQTNGDVAVAIIDEGFQANHVDLADNVVATYNGATKDADVSEVAGENNHGTHVAGIVSAVANNGEGVAGVSYNAKLVLVKGYDESVSNGKALGFSTAALHESFSYILRMRATFGIRVINMSVGGYESSTNGWADKQLIRDIDSATSSGIVVVCSGGNAPIKDSKGTSYRAPYICYPAYYSEVVGVINLQESNNDPHNVLRAPSSNYNLSTIAESSMGAGLNVSAPGTGIYSTIPTNAYGSKDGTSMASPCVAGALALAFAANPSLTASQATSLLYSTATDVGAKGWDAETGYGEVNARGMVDSAAAYLSGETSVQVGKTIAFSIAGSGWVWVTSDSSVATVSNGTVTGISGGQARITAARSMGFFGLWPVASQVVTVYDPSISPSAATIAVGDTTMLTMNCSQSGSWSWTSSDPSVATVTNSGTTVTVTGRKTGTVAITATLNSNSSISTTAEVTVNALSLANATVTWSSTYTYNGLAQKPTPTVKVGSITLTAGTDYTVAYPSDCTSAGTKAVTIKSGASGRCTGSKAASYTIRQASLSGATVTLSPSSYDYDGKAKTPSVTVKVGSRTLVQGADYTVGWPSDRASIGSYNVVVTGKGNYSGIASASFTVGAVRQPLYRLYHPQTGEHHYTLSAYERDVCTSKWGWNYEGIAWYCPSMSSTPVYRLYNPSSNLHHYTTSAYERDVCTSKWGWNYEGIAWYSDDAKGAQLYRLYHPVSGHHHYTLSAYERDVCVRSWGWNYEGIAWYGMK